MLKPSRFLDPKTDIVFKKIFGQNADLMQSFLNGVLPLPSPIQTIEYLPVEQSPRIPSMKNTIVDVKCTDDQGRIFIVEMQLQWSAQFMQRLLFGASKAYVQQMKPGDVYRSLCPVYGLGIVNAIFDKDSHEWFHHYKIVHIKNTQKTLEGLELIFLELPKFQPKTWQDKKMGLLWLRFLKELDGTLTEIPQAFLAEPLLMKAMELAQEAAYTPAELDAYDRYWDAISVEKTVRLDGYLEGEMKGRKEGEITIIEKMLASGMTLTQIATIVGQPVADIQRELERK